MSGARLERTREAMASAGVDALVVGPSADLRYLTGYHALPLERLTLLVVPRIGDAQLIVPALEAPRAAAMGVEAHVQLRTFEETDDPYAPVAQALHTARTGTIAVNERLWSGFLLGIQAVAPDARYVPGGQVMRQLRMIKTADEVEALRAVGAAIDAVHARVPDLLRPGRSEAEVGRDITELILADHDEVNFVIVASGPNSASPHHETGDRILQVGDPVVVDIGGTRQGYCSDVTRTYVLGSPDEEFARLHAVLEDAQQRAVAAVRPGITAEAVDAAARDHLDDAGYGGFFIHRTGHGIGIEEHEEPWIVAGNDEVLAPGMAFSVEPGIYVPDRFGARIEDIVVVTEDGVEPLTRLPHALHVVDVDAGA